MSASAKAAKVDAPVAIDAGMGLGFSPAARIALEHPVVAAVDWIDSTSLEARCARAILALNCTLLV